MITRFKPGVQLTPDPAGTRLLAAIDRVAMNSPYDVTITCGSEAHSMNDPHTLGRAFDVRTHEYNDTEKADLLRSILAELADEPPEVLKIAGIWYALATDEWFGQIEDHGGDNEHLHVQRRNGAVPFD